MQASQPLSVLELERIVQQQIVQQKLLLKYRKKHRRLTEWQCPDVER